MTKTKRTEPAEKSPPRSISVQIKNGPGEEEGNRIDALRNARTPKPSRGAMVRVLMLFGLAAFESAESPKPAKWKGRRS